MLPALPLQPNPCLLILTQGPDICTSPSLSPSPRSRLSTITNADSIAVVSKGRIVEQGGYSELLAGEGAFAALVRVQQNATSATSAVPANTRSGAGAIGKTGDEVRAMRIVNTCLGENILPRACEVGQ